MNKDVFIGYLEDPAKMDASSTSGLKELITQYPYFQTAHLLYLKNLYEEKNIDYSSQLKVAAVYANSRKKLYELVMQSDLRSKINVVDDTIDKSQATLTEVSPLEQQILKEAVSASIEMEVQLERIEETSHPSAGSGSDSGREKEEKRHESKKKKKQPDSTGQFTFNQWMSKINQGEPIPEGDQTSDELISDFIKKAPSLSTISTVETQEKEAFFSPIDTARLSIIDDEEFVTETLAKIYENQHFYEKAIKAYELLSLKYPKNSNTFAARIKTLKEKLNKE